ncbi:FkbM family methyltransferase [Salinispora arenicola]|uniref:FkbM family methyltransferase n=1 Tax=Salinispora arenicola TaxID=168697 RepID=UPI000380734A|nr:FkbM family methyltransferase [Salinispora arenicola]
MNDGETALLYRDIFTERCYIQHGIALAPGDTVFDVGANIGMSTLFFHLERPDVTVHAFEPAPTPHAALIANFAGFGVKGTATRCALSDHSGTGIICYYPDSSVMSGFHADPAAESALMRNFLTRSGLDPEDVEDMVSGRHDFQSIECPMRTLSEMIIERGVTSIDLLKVDVEKSELEVLRGLADEDWPKIRQVVAEVHNIDGALDTFTSLLQGHGFTVAVEQDALLSGTEIYEAFAVRQEA